MENNQARRSEEVNALRWRMAMERVRLADELRIIPRALFYWVAALFVIGQVIAQVAYQFHPHEMPRVAAIGIAAGASLVAGFLLLLFGYVNRDAKRRGMSSTLWTLLAIFVPYLIGLVAYFLVREPLPYNCPQCGTTVSARFNYCPHCKQDLRPTCPSCRREVHNGDQYCPYCSFQLIGT